MEQNVELKKGDLVTVWENEGKETRQILVLDDQPVDWWDTKEKARILDGERVREVNWRDLNLLKSIGHIAKTIDDLKVEIEKNK